MCMDLCVPGCVGLHCYVASMGVCGSLCPSCTFVCMCVTRGACVCVVCVCAPMRVLACVLRAALVLANVWWQVLALDEIGAPLLYKTSLLAKKGVGPLFIIIAVGSRVIIVNEGTQEANLPCHHQVCSFFKGKWWQVKDGDQVTPADAMFELSSADDFVWLGGKAVLLLDAVTEHRKKEPNAKVCYHDLVDAPEPGRPENFKLERKFSVMFRSEDVPSAKVKQEDLAGLKS